jgi:hypothetical protein
VPRQISRLWLTKTSFETTFITGVCTEILKDDPNPNFKFGFVLGNSTNYKPTIFPPGGIYLEKKDRQLHDGVRSARQEEVGEVGGGGGGGLMMSGRRRRAQEQEGGSGSSMGIRRWMERIGREGGRSWRTGD